MSIKVGIGQDSHRFLGSETTKPCIIAGVEFDGVPGFKANSDGDVVYHAICNAISSITHILILGGIADDLCLKDGITDSRVYLERAVETLGDLKIVHLAISIEAKKPHFKDYLTQMRKNIADVCKINVDQVGITATTGEGLTEFGQGVGVQVFALITVSSC